MACDKHFEHEAEIGDMQIKFFYESDEPHDPQFIEIDDDLLEMKVNQAKRELLLRESLDYVKEHPEKLEMWIVLPEESKDEGPQLKKMKDDDVMSIYKDDLSRCHMIKLKKSAL